MADAHPPLQDPDAGEGPGSGPAAVLSGTGSLRCGHCGSALQGDPSCPQCGTLVTTGVEGSSVSAAVEEMERRLGDALDGRYELRGLLGHGGMGAVFLAVELRLDRLVAIKVLPPSLAVDDALLTRFEREARTAARLDHTGIVPIYAVEDVDGLHFFVMKFVPGADLGTVLAQGPMELPHAQEILWEVASALGHAHQRGVVHRDVKPANIMIDPEGRALVTDFGIAKAARASTQVTSTGQFLGTPHYISPEQLDARDVDGRSDQYSLGMVAYHMLAGRAPFEDAASVGALVLKQVSEDPPPLADLRPDLPADVVEAVERAIRKDPDARFPTMEDFAAALWPERAGGPAGGARTLRVGAGRRRRLVAGIAVVAVAVVAGVAAWSLLPGSSVATPEEPPGRVDGSMGGPGAGEPDPPRVESPPPEPGEEVEAAAPDPMTSPDEERERTGERAPNPSGPIPAEPPMGRLTVNAQPVFAYVLVDGVELPNSTPIFEHELAPGTHVLTVRRAGYATIVDTVEVTAGNVTRRSYVLIEN